jgi:hypothetical protein
MPNGGYASYAVEKRGFEFAIGDDGTPMLACVFRPRTHEEGFKIEIRALEDIPQREAPSRRLIRPRCSSLKPRLVL